MKPVVYGYLRLAPDDDTSEEAARIRGELADYAAREGFTLEDVFIEDVRCAESAFYTMIEALKRTEVKHVVIPSLWHFAGLPGLQDALRQHIEQETGARIWVMQEQHQ